MKNKKKTRFQKYLESINPIETPKQSGMSDEVRVSYTVKFYGKNLADFHEVDSENGMRIFNGLSEEGNCVVTEQGGIFCEETGFKGNPVEFIRFQENNLTLFGALKRYFTSIIPTYSPLEGIHDDILDRDSLFDRIEASRCIIDASDSLQSFGLEKETFRKHALWFDGRQRFFYLYLNRLDFPLCKHEWSFDGDSYHERSFGVPKLVESSEAERIYFVENPAQLVSMSEVYPDPIYVRPTAVNYMYHDYSHLINGKQVICVKANNQRSADIKNFDLTFLESDDPLEILYVYEQGEPREPDLSEDILRRMLSDKMDVASASIESYLKLKGESQ